MKTVKSANCCYDSPTASTQFVFASIIQSGLKFVAKTIPSLSLVNKFDVTCEQ